MKRYVNHRSCLRSVKYDEWDSTMAVLCVFPVLFLPCRAFCSFDTTHLTESDFDVEPLDIEGFYAQYTQTSVFERLNQNAKDRDEKKLVRLPCFLIEGVLDP